MSTPGTTWSDAPGEPERQYRMWTESPTETVNRKTVLDRGASAVDPSTVGSYHHARPSVTGAYRCDEGKTRESMRTPHKNLYTVV